MTDQAVPRVPQPGDRVVVVSPHLDDAVLSLGATMATLAGRGVIVTALTLFAGNPGCGHAAGVSNRRAGFATVGEAARVRRREDERALALLGAVPHWLPNDDDEAAPRQPEDLARALASALAGADLVLVPGGPLEHPDHRLATDLVLGLTQVDGRVGLYAEQPYTAWQMLSRTTLRRPPRSLPAAPEPVVALDDVLLRWTRSSAPLESYLRKVRALSAYRSQLRVLRRFPRVRVALSDLLTGGELLAWPRSGRLSPEPSRRGDPVSG